VIAVPNISHSFDSSFPVASHSIFNIFFLPIVSPPSYATTLVFCLCRLSYLDAINPVFSNEGGTTLYALSQKNFDDLSV
jgi:hypothetical protein